MSPTTRKRSRRSRRSRRNGVLIGLFVLVVLGLGAIPLNHAGPNDAFLGDSITEMWHFPRVNLGVHGQTSAQILARFPTQIPNRGYTKVYILAGTNDVLLSIDPAITLRNIEAVADLAQQAHAEPILAEIPPIFRDDGKFTPAVNSLNARIAGLASTRGFKLVDYNAALRDHPRNFVDGVHINRSAYLRMELALLHTTNPF